MRGNFILGVLVGIAGVYLFRRFAEKSGKNPSDLTIAEMAVLAEDVAKEEGGKFSEALKKEYDIVMPSDQVSKKVKAKAKRLTEGRYALKPDNVNEPVTI